MDQPAQQTSWLPDILATLAVASGIGYVATVYSVSRWLTRRSPGTPERPDAHNDLCTWEEHACRTSDGICLRGWVVTPPRAWATVALFHGLRGNRARTLSRMAILTRAGFRCVAFDHRAHGQSMGRFTSFGYYERRDVEAVLELVRRCWPDQPRAALGVSMGAAALCFAAPSASDLDAVILESVYYNVASAFKKRIGSQFPQWFHRFHSGLVWLTERRLRLKLDELAPSQYVQHLSPVPVLLLTGEHDAHAPPEDVERLYRCCREPCEFRVVPEARHTDLVEVGGRFYQEVVLDFLQRQMRRRAPLAA